MRRGVCEKSITGKVCANAELKKANIQIISENFKNNVLCN